MLYNTRVKFYPDGSMQFLHSDTLRTVGVPRKKKGRGSVSRSDSSSVSISRTVQECYDLAKSNLWDWFVTLTFNTEFVNSFDYAACCSAMSKFTRILRDRGVQYLFVPELHKSGRFHFHGLVSGFLDVVPATDPYTCDLLFDNSGRQVYNIDIYKYGFSTATMIDNSGAASNYLMKYLGKELGVAVPAGKKRYWASRGLVRPEKDYYVEGPDDFQSMYMSAVYRKDIKTEFGNFYLYEHDLQRQVED